MDNVPGKGPVTSSAQENASGENQAGTEAELHDVAQNLQRVTLRAARGVAAHPSD